MYKDMAPDNTPHRPIKRADGMNGVEAGTDSHEGQFVSPSDGTIAETDFQPTWNL